MTDIRRNDAPLDMRCYSGHRWPTPGPPDSDWHWLIGYWMGCYQDGWSEVVISAPEAVE